MEWTTLFLRTVFVYFFVFLMLRIMGKREIGKLSVFDLVISIMIAEIAVFVLEDVEKPMIDGLLPMLTLVVIQIVIAFATLKSPKLRSWFDGKPSVIIRDGQLNREEMRKQRYNLDDLLLQLRENKIRSIADVEFAMLETSGKLTVMEKEKNGASSVKERTAEERQPSGADTGPSGSSGAAFRLEGLPLSLIMDGKVQDENLQSIGKDRFWLKNQLQAKGIGEFKQVFYCSIDHRGRLYVDSKRRK